MLIQNARSVAENKLKLVVAGASGYGKTRSVVSLKRAGFKPLVVSAEAGLLSIMGSDIDFIDITIGEDGKTLPKDKRIARLMDCYNFIHSPEAMIKYDLIFIDSISEISQCLFDLLKKEYPERKDSLVMFGELGQKSRDLIKAFRDTSHYHVVFTCLSKVEKDESGKRYLGFDMVGGIADKLPQFFDEILQIRIGKDDQPEFVCKATDSMIAKDRSGKLNPVEPYDLGAIFKKILQPTT